MARQEQCVRMGVKCPTGERLEVHTNNGIIVVGVVMM